MDNIVNTSFNQKADFFNGGYFLINLSAFEAEKKILIPGHRFLPFLNPMVMPWEIKIKTQSNKDLKIITEETHLRTLKPLYSLFGEENILFLLIDDKEENSEIILENEDHSSHNLFFTAYDFSPLFGTEDITKNTLANSALILRIDDWDEGIYTASIKKIDKNPTNAGEWINTLEKGFKKVLSDKKKLLQVSEVMSDAFIHGGKVLLEDPVISLEDFFDVSEISDIADIILEHKEDPALIEKKNYIREKTLSLIKTITSWLENNDEDKKISPETVKILEKQILVTKKTLIAVLEEIHNPLLTEEMLNTIMEIIAESENLVSRIK
ncbi:MAG: hypothetical protein FWD87_06550 [Spirochaetaceae bacterium]|nr:hypothetical protein [Spirochaetaceae bacterium]